MVAKKSRHWIDFAFGFFGLLLASAAWHFDHAEQIPWVQRFAAPQYFSAMRCYERIFSSHERVYRGTPGFDEIASIVKKNTHVIWGEQEFVIESLQITNNAFSITSDGSRISSGPTISLSVTFTDGRSASTSNLPDLRPEIRERFLQNRLFVLAAWIFWAGILISLLALLHPLWRSTSN
jgi:hypothetical protein